MAVKNYRKGADIKLSANFRVAEFDCNGRGCCSQTKIDKQLVTYLQTIRNHFGKAITITSGYRCATHNKSVGGASRSRHLQGTAADITVKGVAPAEVAKYAESIGVKGIGLYDTDKDGHFVHIDTRTSKSFWFGHAQQKRTTFGGAPVYPLEAFVRNVQEAINAEVDGIAGPETLAKTPTVSRWWNRKHPVVVFIQKRLAALGYMEVGNADGEAGTKFTAAVKAFQKDNGCRVDGVLTARNKTWKILLGMR